MSTKAEQLDWLVTRVAHAYLDAAPPLGSASIHLPSLHKALESVLPDEQVRKDTEIGRAVNRAAEKLPVGYELTIDLEQGAGTVSLSDDDGNYIELDTADLSFAEQIDQAIDRAIASAKGDATK